MKSLVRRAHVICSKPEFLEKEIEHLKTVFRDENGFPSRIVNTTINEVKMKFQEENLHNQDVSVADEEEVSNLSPIQG